ncbi:unnamed protein product [Blepharisma stoltei]|uniref:C2H2-type domain-containing protein n=1 Tax=Blepharisma stoltei TaxID=1481888 RepID=A0AAU9IDF4_9CILI|nr:unnamed protein product [Blepharisma stoltei]
MDKDDRYECEYCHQIIKHRYSLERHVKVVHQGYRPFACDCGKQFATKEQLGRHRNSKHSLEKPYQCERGCDKAFSSSSARSYHHKMVHDRQKFRCPMLGCNKQYSSMHHLRNHLSRPHDNVIQLLNTISWLP